MERDEFVKQMMEPDAPNAMDFVIRRGEDADPGLTFSEESLAAVAEQVKTFAMARTYGQFTKAGKPPQSVRARVTLTFDEPVSDARLDRDNVPPWYAIDDKWAAPVDGESRNERGT